MALRMSYFHGLETFFSFLAATIQAPRAVIAYVLKAQPRDLRNVVTAINKCDISLIKNLKLASVSWEGIARAVNCFEIPPEAQDPIPHFAKLWQYLAEDFVYSHHIDEYNSIKHGFRVSSGPTKVEFRPVDSTKYMEMQSRCFGTGFYVPEEIAGAPKGHLKLNRVGVNWSPNTIARRLTLIAASLHNVCSFLKILNGTPGQEVPFRVPNDLENFEYLEKDDEVKLLNVRTNIGISAKDIELLTQEEMLEKLKNESINK